MIRNAQDVSYVIRNAETGEVYFSKDYGKQSGAFYYTNGGYWSNTVTTKGISWRFTDNEGNALPNNTKLELVLTAVPEYYTADVPLLKPPIWVLLQSASVHLSIPSLLTVFLQV